MMQGPLQILEWLGSTLYLGKCMSTSTYYQRLSQDRPPLGKLTDLFIFPKEMRKVGGWLHVFFEALSSSTREKYEWFSDSVTNAHKTKLSSWYRRFWVTKSFRRFPGIEVDCAEWLGHPAFRKKAFHLGFYEAISNMMNALSGQKKRETFNSDSDVFYCPENPWERNGFQWVSGPTRMRGI